ncbi:MAG: hypothetical protein NVS4B7_02300 [Ktedonobacteraceae bacterium]
MSCFDEIDQQTPQEWQNRVAQKRLALSASVEEALQDTSIEIEEELDEAEVSPSRGTNATMLIPPRLTLQSKQLSAVQPQTSSSATKCLPVTSVDKECQTCSFESKLLLDTPGTQSFPRIESVSSAQPLAHTSQLEQTTPSQVKTVATIPSRAAELTQPMLKRTTKVRLQVVPRPEHNPTEMATTLSDVPTNPGLSAINRTAEHAETIVCANQVDVTGSGMFECNQSEIAITNKSITSSSVVVVVLIGDPGPVVVQYVSLQPHLGFTIHLSAPTTNTTPFNYKIL